MFDWLRRFWAASSPVLHDDRSPSVVANDDRCPVTDDAVCHDLSFDDPFF